jgi:hypothetical protein
VERSTFRFPSGQHARAVRVQQQPELEQALITLGLNRGRPVLVLVGGADDLPKASRLSPLFDEIVAVCTLLGACVVDGGTDAGIMRLAGRARAAAGASFPLVGVAAEGTVAIPGRGAHEGVASLEPNHSHFILVPGSEWGDEVPWLGRVADALAGDSPAATLLVNGGEIARRDVEASVRAGRPVVVASGSGRVADELAAEARSGDSAGSVPLAIVDSEKVPGEVARLLGGRK